MTRGRGKALLFSIVFLFCLVGLPTHKIRADAGSYSAPFLTISFGSRAQSLGNALVAITDDASSVYFNPAGLSRSRQGLNWKQDLQLSRSSWLQGITINQMALASFRPRATSWGLAVTNLRVDDIEARTTESEKPDGVFRAEDLALSFSLARRLGFSPLTVGTTAKLVQQRIGSYQGSALALDLGGQMKFRAFNQPFSAGLSVRNLGTKLRLGREAYPLPFSYHLGFAYQGLINQVLEISFNEKGLQNASLGTEYWFLGTFGIRGGYLATYQGSTSESTVAGISVRQGFTGGFGFNVVNRLGIDYAFAPFGNLGFVQRVTFSYKF